MELQDVWGLGVWNCKVRGIARLSEVHSVWDCNVLGIAKYVWDYKVFGIHGVWDCKVVGNARCLAWHGGQECRMLVLSLIHI